MWRMSSSVWASSPAGAGVTPNSLVTAFAETCRSQVNGLTIVCRIPSGIATTFAIASARWSASAFGTSSPSATLRYVRIRKASA